MATNTITISTITMKQGIRIVTTRIHRHLIPASSIRAIVLNSSLLLMQGEVVLRANNTEIRAISHLVPVIHIMVLGQLICIQGHILIIQTFMARARAHTQPINNTELIILKLEKRAWK